MASLQFADRGSYAGTKRQRILAIGGGPLKAKTRHLIRPGANSTDSFVVSGRLVHQQLRDRKIYDGFCRLVDSYRDKTHSNLGAFKLLVAELLNESGRMRFPEYLDVVAWDLGPVPVCRLGECNGLPVYALPELRTWNQKLLFPTRTRDDVNILGAIADTLSDCFHEYFSDVADLLKNAFVGSKTDALKIALETERILGTSVDGKFRLIDAKSKSSELEQTRAYIYDHYNLVLYRAEAAVLRAATASLRWSIGEDIDERGAMNVVRYQSH